MAAGKRVSPVGILSVQELKYGNRNPQLVGCILYCIQYYTVLQLHIVLYTVLHSATATYSLLAYEGSFGGSNI